LRGVAEANQAPQSREVATPSARNDEEKGSQ